MKRRIWGLAVLLGLWALPSAQAASVTMPAGTMLHVVLETTLTTKGNKAGDPFRARLVMPVFINEREAVPIGSIVEGTIGSLKAPGRVKGKAQMQLRPEKLILPDGRDISLTASVSVANAHTGDDIDVDSEEGTITGPGKDGVSGRTVATGSAAGAGIGAAMGGAQGAAIGAGAVGAAALLHYLFKRGKDADLPAGSEIVLELSREVTFVKLEDAMPMEGAMQEDAMPIDPPKLTRKE